MKTCQTVSPGDGLNLAPLDRPDRAKQIFKPVATGGGANGQAGTARADHGSDRFGFGKLCAQMGGLSKRTLQRGAFIGTQRAIHVERQEQCIAVVWQGVDHACGARMERSALRA